MIPKVVIIGRPNVGKSSLLNLLAERRVSIVEPTAGVTRDRIATPATLPPEYRNEKPRHIEVIDTGGYGIKDIQNLTADIERQIAAGIDEAHLILFVIDAQEGITPLDQKVAQMLRRGGFGGSGSRKPVLLIANKIDGPRLDIAAPNLARLGFGEPIAVSAHTGYHKDDLRRAVRNAIDWEGMGDNTAPDPGMLLAIVGKRNAGKSTLVNALAGQDRVIVSELEGTTRDSVDVRFEMDGDVFTAIDTAGVRKGKSLDGDIEYYSQHRSLRSVRRAGVVLFLLDATVPVSGVDKKLATEIGRHHRPTLIVVNKWDLAEKKSTQDDYIKYLDKTLKGLAFAPVAFISAAKGQGLKQLIQTAQSLHKQAHERVSTSELNRILHEIMAQKTPTSGIGRAPKIYYCTQITTNPPTIGMFVNDPTMFDPAYERFLIGRLREMTPYPEVPIRLIIRGRTKAPRAATRPPVEKEANAAFTAALEAETETFEGEEEESE